ncbi:MAG: cysteine desulfurase [Armatimonadetes bacterium]|nr:cysteine desulfurase [Armatimonadota bacterium]
MSALRPENYFDNAATSPLDPAVKAEMLPFFDEDFGNAHSLHAWGHRAMAAVETARARVAELLGCAPESVIFTSGATESNNWVLRNFPDAAVSPFEHSSVDVPAGLLGCRVLGNDGYELEAPETAVRLVSVMSVNNETGAVLTVPDTEGALVHRDLTQTLGKLTVGLTGVDLASVSAHKLYGPKGVGALYASDRVMLSPLLAGGGQELGLRAGTLNVPGIVGFGAACAVAADRMDKDLEHARELRQTVLEVLSALPDWSQNAHTANSPYILSVSFLGIEGETLVIEADARGYALSSGAACSSGSVEPNRVLSSLGLSQDRSRGTVRISFGRQNTVESAHGLATVIVGAVAKLRNLGH